MLTPLLSILVFLVVMSLILWSLNRREQQQQEDTLFRNVAWAQQQIRLSMTGAQEQLQALSRDLASGRLDQNAFQMAVADVMQTHPEILYLNWYVARRAALADRASAAARPAARAGEAQMQDAVRARDEARSTRRQAYSPLIYDDFGNGFITLQTPVMRGDREYLGSIAAVFSVEGILKHDIPQELSSKYKISITDANNRELSSTSTRPRLPRDSHYAARSARPGADRARVRIPAAHEPDQQYARMARRRPVMLRAVEPLEPVEAHAPALRGAAGAVRGSVLPPRDGKLGADRHRVLDMHGRITHVNPRSAG